MELDWQLLELLEIGVFQHDDILSVSVCQLLWEKCIMAVVISLFATNLVTNPSRLFLSKRIGLSRSYCVFPSIHSQSLQHGCKRKMSRTRLFVCLGHFLLTLCSICDKFQVEISINPRGSPPPQHFQQSVFLAQVSVVDSLQFILLTHIPYNSAVS